MLVWNILSIAFAGALVVQGDLGAAAAILPIWLVGGALLGG